MSNIKRENDSFTHSSQARVSQKPNQNNEDGGGEGGGGGGVYHHPISNKLCLFVKLRNFISHIIHFLVNKILKKIVFPLCKVYFSGDLHLKEELTFLSKLNETEMVLKVFLGFS